ncbi:hypothetical protein QUC31_020668 [Theobroma cacao]
MTIKKCFEWYRGALQMKRISGAYQSQVPLS